MLFETIVKRLVADEFTAAKDGVAVAIWLRLGNEPHLGTQGAARVGVRCFIARTYNDGKFLNPGSCGLLEDDLQRGLGFPARVDQRLQRKRALTWICRGNKGFSHFH